MSGNINEFTVATISIVLGVVVLLIGFLLLKDNELFQYVAIVIGALMIFGGLFITYISQ